MKKYLLDTNIVIDFFKNRNNVLEIFKKIERSGLFLSIVVVIEYYQGAFRSNNYVLQDSNFKNFVKAGSIKILSVENSVAMEYAKLQAEFMKKRRMRPVMDLLIASTCVVNDLVLVTQNAKDFEGIKGLKMYNL
ncbi:type II toxin-antitoxin system VapC family toxin [Patescibacteria group bacterium]|nr:type II toxin-antitoxin system VapC family toxin [Patescibacteria group bacterium]MCG2701656.1 type II toxin-antitoxin system VapC family toxin [Candidatus Parcubacteria bacterium]MBU4210868.1 type II toxin-antitoxin system VapC family toxin [Patescibacteria group bacterium]MBU4265004.1 type II toxin-antitoxin system VapC family toxin [Patescibacteria group bacterium]MBU4390157.1 type II toxin-antitoxin system VapC family toxin [Patescibacteria group bacterium]